MAPKTRKRTPTEVYNKTQKRTAAEAFVYYTELLLTLVPNDKQEEAKNILKQWEEERFNLVTQRKKTSSPMDPEKFKRVIEKYLVYDKLESFTVNIDNFKDEESCVSLIKKLVKQDNEQNNVMLRSSVYQGYGLAMLLKLCSNKKSQFTQKLETMEIGYSTSYAYFLIKVSKLILPHELLLGSSMPLWFVKKHFKDIETYIENLNRFTETSFGSQDLMEFSS